MPSPFRIERTIVVPLSPDRLWPLLADTEGVNRSLGLPPVSYRFESLPGGGVRTWAQARLFGIPLEWEEKPFEWTRGRAYEIERVFQKGPIARVRVGTQLTAVGNGTSVTTYGEFVARRAVLKPVVRVMGARQIEKFIELLARLGRDRSGEPASLPEGPVRADLRAIEETHKRLSREIPDADHPILKRLAEDLISLPDSKVLCIRPFAWADLRGFPRVPALMVFLHATTAGLLDMDWALICPHCRGKAAVAPSLADIPQEGDCPTCQVRFAVEFDRAVEARFSVAQRVRRAVAGIFCRGGPMNTPFIGAQYRVPAGGSVEIPHDLLSGLVQVRMTGPLDRTTGAKSGVALFNNRTDREIVLSVEDAEWDAQAASAALIATLPAFQNLFAADVLAPGQEVAVRRLVVLFSDLKGSTALYRQVGDARAYALVREHFRAFEEILAAHEGAMVKTIGDSVMAVFLRAHDAVAAAARAHASCAPPVLLKIGLHAGPLLAVSANKRNDYFGTTVNIAARLKDLAEAGETILSAEVADETAAAGPREAVPLKGIDTPVEILRVCAGAQPVFIPGRPGPSAPAGLSAVTVAEGRVL